MEIQEDNPIVAVALCFVAAKSSILPVKITANLRDVSQRILPVSKLADRTLASRSSYFILSQYVFRKPTRREANLRKMAAAEDLSRFGNRFRHERGNAGSSGGQASHD